MPMPLLLFLALLGGLAPSRLGAQTGAPAVARIVVDPAEPTLTSGDTLRLRAEALDAAGRPVPGAVIRFESQGVYHRASVTLDGLVVSGNTGRFPVVVTATAPGAEPVSETIVVRMVTGDAAYVEITPPVERLAVGQEWALTATIYSRLREIRREPVTWTSSAPEILEVDERGRLTALAPGRATITAAGSGTEADLPVEVVGTPIARIELTPSMVQARPGQVIRFKATPLDTAGAEVSGLTAVYTVSPKGGVISPDGIFIGYDPGEYTVTASFGAHRAEAVVRLAPAPGR